MTKLITAVEARVLGALIEKEITTPEYYPLSLHALVNACNQKNNREPVMQLDEDTIRQALHGLEDSELAGPARALESRVTKYEHRLQEIFNFTRGEIAVLCILLLRGPQTLGELRGRTDRMYRFEDLSDVQAALDRLMRRDPPLARTLPRQPGTKEARSIHLLCGDTESFEPAPPPLLEMPPGSSDRIPRLEAELAAVQEDVAELKRQVEKLLKLVE
jgi:uncharacterized protein YceH (UPF0502 family)